MVPAPPRDSQGVGRMSHSMRAPAGHSRELSTSPPKLVKELVTAPNLGASPSQCGGRGLAQGDILPLQAAWPWSGPHHPSFRASPVR